MNTNTKRTNMFVRLAAALFAPISNPAVLQIKNVIHSPVVLPTLKSNLNVEDINWRWRSQRQVRKNRRRALAAGCKNIRF